MQASSLARHTSCTIDVPFKLMIEQAILERQEGSNRKFLITPTDKEKESNRRVRGNPGCLRIHNASQLKYIDVELVGSRPLAGTDIILAKSVKENSLKSY
jgi:hypothetical protein